MTRFDSNIVLHFRSAFTFSEYLGNITQTGFVPVRYLGDVYYSCLVLSLSSDTLMAVNSDCRTVARMTIDVHLKLIYIIHNQTKITSDKIIHIKQRTNYTNKSRIVSRYNILYFIILLLSVHFFLLYTYTNT